jgi:tRNA (guanine37-N1)-methyltransferase
LLSGHHAQVRAWRQAMREETTRKMRPDLWAKATANQQAKGDRAQ